MLAPQFVLPLSNELCGNSVSPPAAEAIIRANYKDPALRAVA